ncbi:MAG: penicillin-binding protein [Phycisphaerae bacterium]|nr:penicillin-binding protein [Phycisphaerae bacterium]
MIEWTMLVNVIAAMPMVTTSVASDGLPATPPGVADRLDRIRERFEVPALAAFAMKGDEIIAIEAVGVRARGDASAVTVEDRWHLGSCGKAMSATVLDRVVARGDLAWDTTIGEVFGDLDEVLPAWHDVTVRRLVQHRSRLPENAREPLFALRSMPPETSLPDQRLELVRLVLARPPVETDGSKMRYSNYGYAVAAAMAERRTGRDWESMCRELLFETLGMSDTGFGAPGSMTEIDQPRGHRNEMPIPPSPFADNPPAISAAGTIHSTMTDWSKFLAAHLDAARGEPGVFDAGRLQELQLPPDGGDYASGWMVVRRDWAKGPVLTHSGTNTLWHSVVWMAPARDWVMAAVTNAGGMSAAKACDAAIGVLIDELRRLEERESSTVSKVVETGSGSE